MRRPAFVFALLPALSGGLLSGTAAPAGAQPPYAARSGYAVPSRAAAELPWPVAPTLTSLPVAGVNRSALADLPPESGGSVQPGASTTPYILTAPLATRPFSALGVSWVADRRVRDVAVQVRVRSGGRWGAWEEAEVEPGAAPDADVAEGANPQLRAGSDPLWVGGGDGVQVRVDAAGVRPRDVQVTLIDPGRSPADDAVGAEPPADALAGTDAAAPAQAPAAVAQAAPPLGAQATPARPRIYSRQEWGADESLRRARPSYTPTIKAAIVHNTASGNDYSSRDVPAIIRSSYAYHVKTLGWSDLGYNFMIDKFGRLWEGRAGGVDRAVMGSHTGGFNSYTFGAAVIGNYDRATPSAASLRTLEALLAWKLAKYSRNPTKTTKLTSAGTRYTFYPAGKVVTANIVSGHRNFSPKSCPGSRLYPLLPQIRRHVAERMGLIKPPKTGTRTTAAVSASAVTYGVAVTVHGTLRTSSGRRLAAKKVLLQSRAKSSSTWRSRGTAKTAADGTFRISQVPTSSGYYRVRFAGDSGYSDSTSTSVRTVVLPAISLASSSQWIRLGQRVQYGGTVLPAHRGAVVVRQAFYRGAWHSVGATRTDRRGAFLFDIRPPARGFRFMRVVVPATDEHAPLSSRILPLGVL